MMLWYIHVVIYFYEQGRREHGYIVYDNYGDCVHRCSNFCSESNGEVNACSFGYAGSKNNSCVDCGLHCLYIWKTIGGTF